MGLLTPSGNPGSYKNELDYRSHYLKQDIKQVMLGMIVWAIAYLLNYHRDFQILGIVPAYIWLLVFRIGYFTLVLMITWTIWFHVRDYLVFDRLVLAWAIASVLASIIVYEVAPRLDEGRYLIDLVAILSLYLCIPNNLGNRMVPALVFTGYDFYSVFVNQQLYSTQTINAIIFSFTALNLVCIFISVFSFSSQRRQFDLRTEEMMMRSELQRLASTDPLTGINNRRRLFELAAEAFYRFRRYGRPFTLIVMDLDGFKQVNDTYGHQQGDQTLIDFTRMLAAEKRDGDALGRTGGDEFCLVLPETRELSAVHLAERILLRCLELPINHNQVGETGVTVSIGIAEVSLQDMTVDSLFSRADAAMYTAKRLGKNRMQISSTGIALYLHV